MNSEIKRFCVEIDANTIYMKDDYLIKRTGYSEEIEEYLSNKTVIVEECHEHNYVCAVNLKNSKVIVKKLYINPSTKKAFKFNEEKMTLEEKPDYFEFDTRKGSHVVVEKYCLRISLADSFCPSVLDYVMAEIKAGKAGKITFKHSNKLSDSDNDESVMECLEI